LWIEELGKDTVDSRCAPPPPPPVVTVRGANEACISQAVDFQISVQNPSAANQVDIYVDGRSVASASLRNGAAGFVFPGAQHPGTYEIKAVAGGISTASTLTVRPCLPVCSIAGYPLPAVPGKPFRIDLTGSRVAAGVRGSIKSAKVEVLDPGGVAAAFDMAGSNLTRDIVIKEARRRSARTWLTRLARSPPTPVSSWST